MKIRKGMRGEMANDSSCRVEIIYLSVSRSDPTSLLYR